MKQYYYKAKFTGLNGSLGFRTNESYTLAISQEPRRNIKIETTDPDRTLFCDYESINSFLANWELLKYLPNKDDHS